MRRNQKHTDFDATLGDHGTVGLVNDVVDKLEVIRVRDNLVSGEDILFNAGSIPIPVKGRSGGDPGSGKVHTV